MELGAGGLAGEIADLRRDVDEAFATVENTMASMGAELVGKVPFDFATGVENLLDPILPGQIILGATILITVGFDGAGASLSFGTTTDPVMLLTIQDTDISTPGQVNSDHYVPVMSPDRLLLTLHTNGSTRGAGFLLFRVR